MAGEKTITEKRDAKNCYDGNSKMGTRQEIIETFYTELLNATDGLVPEDDISLISPDPHETTPSIVYDKSFREIQYNHASSAPDEIIRDSNGDVVSENFHEFIEAQILISIRAADQGELEPRDYPWHLLF